MTETEKEKVALFRYGIIAPVINGQVTNASRYFLEQAQKSHDVPYLGRKDYTHKTFASWLADYRKQGFDGLKPGSRNDQGVSRKLSSEVEQHIVNIRLLQPDIPFTVFFDQLLKSGELVPGEASFATVYRIMKRHGLIRKNVTAMPERKRFAHDQVNFCWQGDASDGPYIPINGKKTPVTLFAFIDDCSRIIPFAQFYPDGRYESMREVFKQALLRRGLPKILYLDNGKIYRSQALELACAELGISLAHTHPYDAPAKGKIERFFRTVQTRFYPLLKLNPANSLEELNQRFWQWLEEDYHRKSHASLPKNMTPLDLFLSQQSAIRWVKDPAQLEHLFLVRDNRKVKHDGTISVKNRLYEVPANFIGQRIEVRFNDSDIFVYQNGKPTVKAIPVNLSDNAFVKRQRNISFAQIEGDS